MDTDAVEVEIELTDPADASARHCLDEYFAELGRRFATGFDPSTARPLDAADLRPPAGLFLVATRRDRPVGCGGLRFHDDRWAEIKRLWVSSETRGVGLGRRLLALLETEAAEHGALTVRLDTNRTLEEAIAMYRSAGYREIDAFNDDPYAHHWFEKHLDRPNPVPVPAPEGPTSDVCARTEWSRPRSSLE